MRTRVVTSPQIGAGDGGRGHLCKSTDYAPPRSLTLPARFGVAAARSRALA